MIKRSKDTFKIFISVLNSSFKYKMCIEFDSTDHLFSYMIHLCLEVILLYSVAAICFTILFHMTVLCL